MSMQKVSDKMLADTGTMPAWDGSALTGITGGGKVVQVVNTQDGEVATGTTTLPNDDSIPQNTEGDEYMTLAITPTNTNNKLLITCEAYFANTNSVNTMVIALFQDSTAGALASGWVATAHSASDRRDGTLVHYMTAGTTSSTTFKIRIGCDGAGTTTFNGVSSGRQQGGVMASRLTIMEIAV